MADSPIKPYSNSLPTSATTLFTVPTGEKYVLRSIHVCNASGAARTFNLSIGPDGTGTRLFSGEAVPADDEPFEWKGFQVVHAGEIVQGVASGTNLVATISAVRIV